jgi:translocator protein
MKASACLSTSARMKLQTGQSQTSLRTAWALIGSLILSFAVAAIGAVASIDAAPFYAQLAKPSWAPPAGVFGPVWTLLYALMAIAAWQVWRQGGLRKQRRALTLYLIQLGMNALWSWLFFGWHLGRAAFVDVVLLWVAVAATLLAFWRASRVAAALLVPYLLWISFAAVLNYTVWQLNPAQLG